MPPATSPDRTSLVIGADSMIGSALLADLRRAGLPCLGTSRRPERIDKEEVFGLDLARPESWDKARLEGHRVAFLCAAVARLEHCHADPEGSRQVNVTGAIRLARMLAERGCFVIFLSTNQVFDGQVPHRLAGDAPCPLSEYGRQKADAERGMLELGDQAAVLRLTKVLGGEVGLFAGWLRDLRGGKAITPFHDMSLAPVLLATVVTGCRRLGDAREPGLWQLSGTRDISYAEAARLGAELHDLDTSLVQPVGAVESGVMSEPPPAFTSLDCSRMAQVFGLAVPETEQVIAAGFPPPSSKEGDDHDT